MTSAIAPLAIALGDPAGIGPEVTAKAWALRDRSHLSPFFAVGDARSVEAVWDGPVARITDPMQAASLFDEALPVIQVVDAGDFKPGSPSPEGARCALASLEMAIGLARSDASGGLVTGPISKICFYEIGFTHPGQTEFVAERCGISPANAVMLLAGPDLKVVPMTTHIPMASVPEALSIELLVCKGRATARGLTRNFGIANPKLAFAGYNPHSGEGGQIGREELDIIGPAVAQLVSEGIDASGPFAPDAMFHARARQSYDVAMCVYHDQALIPLKTLHFDDGVNMTLGLPIVRTSPDHGTAFDIAGQNRAEPGAMIAAIQMAASAARFRLLDQ